MKEKTLKSKIKKIKLKLMAIGDMRPGNLSKQYNVCGSLGCKCKNKNNPKKHGPYYYLSYTLNGKSYTKFVKPNNLILIKHQIANYKKFKNSINKWIDLAANLAQLKFNPNKS